MSKRQRQPPQRETLYALLLESGAEPYDIQVLYNTHFGGDILWWLRLTYEHAVATGRAADWQDSRWPMLDMGGYGSGARFVLDTAIEKDRVDVAEWALAHGADPNAPPPRARGLRRTSLYDRAHRENRPAIAELLVRHGAKRTVSALEGEDAFVHACLGLDRAAAEGMAQRHPECVQSPTAMFAAAARDQIDAIQMLLDIGTPVDVTDDQRQTSLHIAAANDTRRVAAFLIARGADVDAWETRWGASPIGYAAHHGRAAMIDLLSASCHDVWQLAYHGKVERLHAVLKVHPSGAAALLENGVTTLWWLPNEAQAVAVAELLLGHGADPTVRAKDGTTAAEAARLRGLDDAADLIAAAAASRRSDG